MKFVQCGHNSVNVFTTADVEFMCGGFAWNLRYWKVSLSLHCRISLMLRIVRVHHVRDRKKTPVYLLFSSFLIVSFRVFCT